MFDRKFWNVTIFVVLMPVVLSTAGEIGSIYVNSDTFAALDIPVNRPPHGPFVRDDCFDLLPDGALCGYYYENDNTELNALPDAESFVELTYTFDGTTHTSSGTSRSQVTNVTANSFHWHLNQTHIDHDSNVAVDGNVQASLGGEMVAIFPVNRPTIVTVQYNRVDSIPGQPFGFDDILGGFGESSWLEFSYSFTDAMEPRLYGSGTFEFAAFPSILDPPVYEPPRITMSSSISRPYASGLLVDFPAGPQVVDSDIDLIRTVDVDVTAGNGSGTFRTVRFEAEMTGDVCRDADFTNCSEETVPVLLTFTALDTPLHPPVNDPAGNYLGGSYHFQYSLQVGNDIAISDVGTVDVEDTDDGGREESVTFADFSYGQVTGQWEWDLFLRDHEGGALDGSYVPFSPDFAAAFDVGNDSVCFFFESEDYGLVEPIEPEYYPEHLYMDVCSDSGFSYSESLPCDLNADGSCDIDDIDALIMEIAAMNNNPSFDLNGDELVDLADRDAWLTEAGAMNLTSANAYLIADFNLDGVVDGNDFLAWNNNKFAATGKWSLGDANGDGVTDGADFLEWNNNKFQSSDGVVAVPEPGAAMLSVGFVLLGVAMMRR